MQDCTTTLGMSDISNATKVAAVAATHNNENL